MRRFKISTVAAIAVYAMLAVVFSGCENKHDNYTQKKIGIVMDATVVPTSFNEQIKVQIKTDRQFFIVGANGTMPQLNIGDSLTGLFSRTELRYIIDSRGVQFKVR